MRLSTLIGRIGAAAFAVGVLSGPLSAASVFFQTNLTSDIPGMAANTDPNLKNPWGMAFSATSPFWASDQGTNVSTLYNAAGAPQALVVATPPSPTGVVFNSLNSFLLPGGAKATFIFDSLSGQIAGWNNAQGTTAVTEFSSPNGGVFTGLAIANNGADHLYTADFSHASIDVFDGSFAPTTLPGGFTDPNLPAGYSPYNIQVVGGKLYVQYAKVDPVTHMPTTTPNTGIVNVFDLNGNMLQRLVTDANLNSPWGVTQAPSTFGTFGNDILVGNFGDGTISAFDPVTGAFQGMLSGTSGNPIVNSGLWAINFRAPGSGFDANTLFFNAGINGEADGLFGEIQLTPEPATFWLAGLAMIAILWRSQASRLLRKARKSMPNA